MDRPTVPAGRTSHRPSTPAASHLAQRLPLRLRPWAPWIATAARLGLAVVWAWAARAKILEPDGAVVSVRAYRLLPEALVHPVAWGLPFLELALAVLLAAGVATRLAATTSAGLLLVFIAGTASAWARGLSIDCGCFSKGGQLAPGQHPNYLWDILRDVALLVVAVFLLMTPRTRISVDSFLLGPEESPQ
jgi:uncharacterized membrane protein YphA (DoxX/SURF4 family)